MVAQDSTYKVVQIPTSKIQIPFYSRIIYIAFFFLLWFLSGWNTFNEDYDNYESRYNYVSNEGADISKLDFGYDLIQGLFASRGVDFETYHIVIYGIAILALGYFIYKWSLNPLFVVFFYFFFHFLRDTVELRNFLASIFVLYTLFFYGRDTNKSRILIMLLLFLGFSIHMSFILYLPFIFADCKKKLRYKSFLLLSFFASLIAGTLFGFGASFLNFSGLEDKVADYSSIESTWGFALCFVLASINGITLRSFEKEVATIQNIQIRINHLSLQRFFLIINNINALSCFFVAFSSINASFYLRLFSNILIVNIILFLWVIYYSKKKIKLTGILVIYIIIFTYFMRITPFSLHLMLFLSNNSLFGW